MIREPRLMAYGGPGNDPSQSLVYDVRAILALRDSDPKGATSCQELTGHPAKDLPTGKWGVIPFPSAKARLWADKGCLLDVRQTSTGWKVKRVKRRVWEAELGAEAAWFWAMLESAAWYHEAHPEGATSCQPKDEPEVAPDPEPEGPKIKSKRRRKLEKQRRREYRKRHRESEAT